MVGSQKGKDNVVKFEEEINSDLKFLKEEGEREKE